MAIGDILRDIGSGVKTGARAAGAVAAPFAEGVANEEAAYAPQIAAEKRQRAEQLEDATINAKAQELESQLAMGQKYGTLTSQQQQQYIDQITGLYSHPRHAATLMEKLRKAIHPNGAYAQGPQTTLPNATPLGGTAAEDARLLAERQHPRPVPGVHPFKGPDGKYYQPMYDAYGNILNEEVQGYTPPEQKGVGKSPPVTGDHIPQDAVGVDGEPIPAEERNAGRSFVEYQGKWWPVAKPKPVFKTIKGHSVLVDPQNGAVLRDLGPVGTAKVTTRQTLQPGDDGQMHLVNLTSVTTPEGATIEVDTGGQTEAPQPSNVPSSQPKSPAKRVNPGSILPKAGAKQTHSSFGGSIVPGLSTLAHSKNPLFRADIAQYTKAAEDANIKAEAYQSAQKALASGSTASSDQELIYSWVRSNVQGSGRMTQAEFRQAASVGSLPQRAQIAWEKTKTGKLPPEIEQMLLADIKRSAETAQQEAATLRQQVEGGNAVPSTSAPAPVKSNDPLGVL